MPTDTTEANMALIQRPRLPNVERVVKQISVERITLGGGRRGAQGLAELPRLQLEGRAPCRNRLGQYGQLGLNGKKVAWMADIGLVVREGAPASTPSASSSAA